jgi:serine/threonine-protein kinase
MADSTENTPDLAVSLGRSGSLGSSPSDVFLRELADTGGVTGEALVPGAVLDRFVVRRLLGRGGMGVVYEARDERLGRDVAIKLLDARHVGRPERRKRFAREARAAAAVTHPNVARVLEVGDGDAGTYLVFELVPGPTLRALLAEGPLPVARCAEIGAALAGALAAAHEAGVVHRDLKPENVIVEGGVTPKILDFGLAKVSVPEGSGSGSDVVTVEGHVLGSPGYMSPEQALGKPCGPASDVFSLGVVLFELATGKRPFSGTTAMEAIVSTTRDAAPDACALRPEVPRAFSELVASCLAKEPDARPSARELEARLSAPLPHGAAEGEAEPAVARAPTDETDGAETSFRVVSRETPFEAAVATRAPSRPAKGPLVAASLLAMGLAAGLFVFARSGPSPAHEPPRPSPVAAAPNPPAPKDTAAPKVESGPSPAPSSAPALAPSQASPVKATNVHAAPIARPAGSALASAPTAALSAAPAPAPSAKPAPTATLAAPSFSERK